MQANNPLIRWRFAAAVAAGVLATAAPAVLRAQGAARLAGWSQATHGVVRTPDYGRLFTMDRVHEIRIVMSRDSFQQMQADLKAISPAMPPGMPGPGGGPGAQGPQAMAALMQAGIEACTAKAPQAACGEGPMEGTCGDMFGGPLMCIPKAFGDMAQGGAPRLTTRDPIYVRVTVQHDGRTWTNVGMRYKGNSSLMATNMSGNGKAPFRLNFDRYAGDVPETRDQRFYGFEELTFSSNFSDDSQIREALAAEIFRSGGVPAPRTAFYKVFVDTGSGAEYWGLYTMVEDPSDGGMLAAQFGGKGGNLYKPDGPGADWTKFDAAGFDKKSNEKQADYSDVSAAIAALHGPRTDPAAWRAGLESRFDVDHFLKWLAINTAIENWDTYGVMSHNYYLYADPGQKGRLRWIPWDNNMAFGVGPMGPAGGRGFGGVGLPGGPPPGRGVVPAGFPPGRAGLPGLPGFGPNNDVLHKNVASRWPLIRVLLADDVYAARYRRHMSEASRLLAPDVVGARARRLHALIASAVVGPAGERASHTTVTSPDAFQNALDGPAGLLPMIARRQELIRTALTPPGQP